MQTGARTPVLGPWDLATSLVGLGTFEGLGFVFGGTWGLKWDLTTFEFDEDIDRARR
jgi:hypothetical protein